MMGVSRSAVLVAAYLMIFQDMTIMDALTELRKKRAIYPNEGFIKQLRQLNENLQEERDEDNETLSQCSVIDMHAQMEEEESLMGVKAHSIMMEEEEDCASVMSSVASSAAAAALKAGIVPNQNGVDSRGSRDSAELPGKGGEDEDDDDIDSVIREWQRRNEKYQSEDWWEAQLMSEGEDDGESLPGEGKRGPKPEDLDSVTSEDVRAMKETLKKRRNFDTASVSSCTSYSDLWKQRLREIEEEAANRYKARERDEESDCTEGEDGAKCSRKKIDEELESIMSDSSSMYNFCKKNKENLSVLERWKVKRIHYGWNKKDSESDAGSVISAGGRKEGEGETPTPSLEDVNLTAYQTWKLKQQKKYGYDENKDELADLSRTTDSATTRRRQRREEVLERSRKTLEESQSVCGWEEASALTGSIPLSAFCAGAFPAPSVAPDDSVSMISGRSHPSQARSVLSQPAGQQPQLPPMPPIQTQDGEPMVNIASIQNWISNVVVETLMKQGDMMDGGSVLGSVLGSALGVGTRSRVGSVRGLDDDKASMLSGASGSSVRPRSKPAESVLSAGGLSRHSSEYASRASEIGSLSGRRKVTTTSVPLYSLFQDEVNLQKLNSMDEEIKVGMRDKMAAYEKKKIAEDNKRSTLYKKKKPKDEEEEEEEDTDTFMKPGVTSNSYDSAAQPSSRPKFKRDYGLSGRLNISGITKDKSSSIDEWLKNVRPPSSKPVESLDEYEALTVNNVEAHSASSEVTEFSRRRYSHTSEEDDDVEAEDSASRFYANTSNSTEFTRGRQRAYTEYTSREESSCHTQYDTGVRETERRGRNRYGGGGEEEEEEDLNDYISQIRQRCRERVQRELEEKEDEVLSAWREQEESKSHKRDNS